MQVSPRDIKFLYEVYGKPFLHIDSDINFNVSHSYQEIVIAFTRQLNIGIDIEFIQEGFDVGYIINNLASKKERKMFCNINEHKKIECFFKWWTCKEAYIKAIGKGFYENLKNFDVTLYPDEDPEIFNIKNNSNEVDQWDVKNIPIFSGYSCTLVAEKPMKKIVQYNNALNYTDILKSMQ